MTSPVIEVKLLAAELLFILCKESVERLVRYTGYGNAAGLLASRGLMAPQKAAEQNARSASNYSDDDDSDTEVYDELRNKLVKRCSLADFAGFSRKNNTACLFSQN